MRDPADDPGARPVVLVTGLSGAGKASILRTLEDLGFETVDNPPLTILAGVRKLPPATVRVIETDGRYADTQYWAPSHSRHPEYAGMTENDWQDLVLDKLRVAVKRRMVADVPVGVLLSGGLDSSIIVALLARQGQTGLKTFSIGFDADGFSELPYARQVAERYGTEHHEVIVGFEDFTREFARLCWVYDEPVSEPAAISPTSPVTTSASASAA